MYFTVYAQQGFWPTSLINLRVAWETDDINDLEDSYGQEWVSQEFFNWSFSLLTALPSYRRTPTFLNSLDETDLDATRLTSARPPSDHDLALGKPCLSNSLFALVLELVRKCNQSNPHNGMIC